MESKITLMGMYQYNDSLFDTLSLPNAINKDLAIERILNKSEEFELVYSNFNYLRERIGVWSQAHQRTFERWFNALEIEYDPLYNYDRHEDIEDTAESHSTTTTTANTTSNTENKVSAYDSDGYSNKERADSGANTSQDGIGDADSKTIRKAHLYGNIGVTTSQQMLRDELDVAVWSLYDHIAELFIEEFCILVY